MAGPREFDEAPLRRRRFRTRIWSVVLVLLLLGVIGAVLRDDAMVWYYARQIARNPNDDPWPVMEKMVLAGPAGAKWVLHDCRAGSADGSLAQRSAGLLKEADYDVYPYVSALFEDEDPRTRAYAATVAGCLGDRRYAEAVKKLTGDAAGLPKGWTDSTVSVRAKRALLNLPD